MIPGSAIPLLLAQSGDDGYKIDKSLRFNSGDSAYLNRTPSSAGNRKIWTWSGWVKRSRLGVKNQRFMSCLTGSNDNTYLELRSFDDDTICLSGYATNFRVTDAEFRDPSAWLHLVVACDTTQSSNSDRVKLYINGVQQTFRTEATITQNADLGFNQAAEHKIGDAFGGYLAEINFIDGQQLAATDFGEYDDNNVWQPKEYAGTYGTNGFHLDFSDNSSNAALGYDAAATQPALAPKGGMDVVTYTGNGGTQSIGGLAFQPDFVWIKQRSGTYDHAIFDSVRGALKRLRANQTNAEGTDTTTLTSFNTNGFTTGSDDVTNKNSDTYVAWCWKAGGTAASNTDGTITSSVSANTTYGFSIATFTTPSSGTFTFGHGLSAAPKLIIVKARNQNYSWSVYAEPIGNDKYLVLNTSAAQATSSIWNDTTPTSSVVHGNASNFGTSTDYIAYCWSEVAGFSKFGSYSGASNLKITTGFKPRYILIKCSSDSGFNWVIVDGARGNQANGVSNKLYPNLNVAENNDSRGSETKINFLDDGFQFADQGAETNSGGRTYIYAAFADRPGNNWTPNNLSIGTPYYRNQITGDVQESSAGLSGSQYNRLLFDGNSGSPNVMAKPDGTVTWTPEAAYTGVSDIAFYTYYPSGNTSNGTLFYVNGSLVTPTSKSQGGWTTLPAPAGGTVSSVGFGSSGSDYVFVSQIRINNVVITEDTEGIDSLIDTPTNYEADSGNNGGNYATLNPLAISPNITPTVSNGNLEIERTATSSQWTSCGSTFAVSGGKYYWELRLPIINGTIARWGVADADDYEFNRDTSGSGLPWLGSGTGTSWAMDVGGNTYHNGSTVSSSYSSTVTTGDVIGVALDCDANTLTFYKNGTSLGVAHSNVTASRLVPAVSLHGGTHNKIALNFGQRPFAYTPPTGYKSLCTTNLADPTIADGSTEFDAVLYTGTNASKTITGLNFSPDFIWTKSRSRIDSHGLHDIVRGRASNLYSDLTNGENTSSASADLVSFDSNGYTLGTVEQTAMNRSGETYVAWVWDAGTGSPVSNTDGSITSSVLANPSAGFSIVKFTNGNGTVGHGLNSPPELILTKDLDATYTWSVYSRPTTKDAYLALNSSQASSSVSGMWGSAEPTSSVFGTTFYVAPVGDELIAYCFAPVEGYSAFGSYEGNGSTDGPFVYTGHKPSLVMYKNIDAAGGWQVYDTARSSGNVADERLQWNNAAAEDTTVGIDILSNGFKLRTTHSRSNASGNTYIWASFASNPFKYARAR